MHFSVKYTSLYMDVTYYITRCIRGDTFIRIEARTKSFFPQKQKDVNTYTF